VHLKSLHIVSYLIYFLPGLQLPLQLQSWWSGPIWATCQELLQWPDDKLATLDCLSNMSKECIDTVKTTATATGQKIS